jgi:hypothetical protein
MIFTISKELDDLEKVLFDLLRKAIEKWQKVYIEYNVSYRDKGPTYDNVSSMRAAKDLILQFSSIFYDILNVYMFRSTILWPEKVKHKNTPKKIQSITFTKISDMRLRISSMVSTVHTGEFDILFFYDKTMWRIYGTQNLLEYVKIFKDSALEAESELD